MCWFLESVLFQLCADAILIIAFIRKFLLSFTTMGTVIDL
jgi:hypothetical protein